MGSAPGTPARMRSVTPSMIRSSPRIEWCTETIRTGTSGRGRSMVKGPPSFGDATCNQPHPRLNYVQTSWVRDRYDELTSLPVRPRVAEEVGLHLLRQREGVAPRLSERALEWFGVADSVEVDRTEENDAGAVPRLPARGRPGPCIRADRNQRQDQETRERVAE